MPQTSITDVSTERGQNVYVIGSKGRRPLKDHAGNLTTGNTVLAIPSGAKLAKVYASVLARVGVGTDAAGPASSVAQVWTLTGGDATSGNFTITWHGITSGNIAYNVSAANLKTALNALSPWSPTGVATTSGGALNSAPIVITLDNAIIRGNHPLPTITTVDLAGGVSASSRLPTIANTTPGSNALGYIEAGKEDIIVLDPADTYLYLRSDAVVGTFRVSWIG